MATLIKRTNLSRYTSNFSDMLFMVIVMALPRGFSDFVLETEKYAKTCQKMVIFVDLDFLCFFPISRV